MNATLSERALATIHRPAPDVSSLSATPLLQVSSVAELFGNAQAVGRLHELAARELDPQFMVRLLMNAVRNTPQLAQCTPLSFLGAAMACVHSGLEPNTDAGEAYLIPRNNTVKDQNGRERKELQATLQIGYKGYIKRAYRSGLVTRMSTGVHYSDDPVWEYEEGTHQNLRHTPGPGKGQKLHAWAMARVVVGPEPDFVMAVLKWQDVERRKAKSQNQRKAWRTDEDAMAMKSAVRALANSGRLPQAQAGLIGRVEEIDGRAMDYEAFALTPSAGLVDLDGDGVAPAELVNDGAAQIEGPKSAPEPADKAAVDAIVDDMTNQGREALPHVLSNHSERIAALSPEGQAHIDAIADRVRAGEFGE